MSETTHREIALLNSNGTLTSYGSTGGGGGGSSKRPSLITVDSTATVDNTPITKTVTVIAGDGVLSAVSSDTSICTVSIANNVVTITGVDSGEATVTVYISETENYELASASIAVTSTVVKLVSWSSGTDEEIAAMIDGYYDGTFSLADIQSVWSIGDVRSIDLGAIAASGTANGYTWSVGESHSAKTKASGKVQLQILGFDHDTLTTSTGGKTKALITVDTKNVLVDDSTTFDGRGGNTNTENGYINSTDSSTGGWTSSARRKWCNGGYYSALPSYLKTRVKPVNKKTSAGAKSSTINTDSDYCFLLSMVEIFNSTSASFTGEGTQYAWYANATANHYKLPKWSTATQVSDYWWGRSPHSSSTSLFCRVDAGGGAGSDGASYTRGLAPAFAL